jgi:Flp pilus assembly protein TadG
MLAHDPEKWIPVFGKRSCATKQLERDDGSKKSHHALGHLRQDEDGTALIEGAIIVPVLCILLFGVYEFSWFFYQQHLVSTGLRDAARYLARASTPCNPESTVWIIDQAGARNLATTGSILGGTARVKGWTAAAVRLTCTPIDNPIAASGLNAYRGGPVIYVVTASTRFTDPALGFLGLLGLTSPSISVSHSERVIGPG